MFTSIDSVAIYGIDGVMVYVEADAGRGLPNFRIVGLPDASVNEARERVRAAILNSGFNFPPRRLVVNMGPADLKKRGSHYDLPIALAVLAATGQISGETMKNMLIVGELALDGKIRAIEGALPMAVLAKSLSKVLVLPGENLHEASLAEEAKLLPVYTLKDVTELLNDRNSFLKRIKEGKRPVSFQQYSNNSSSEKRVTLTEIKGQKAAKRALEIAAAGGHHLILIGPPGAGKTMLASALPSILPAPSYDELLETTRLWSVAGLTRSNQEILSERPFRAPHTSTTLAGMIGGGREPAIGEVSLAHNGVLFLDELPLFKKTVLESLRSPLVEKRVSFAKGDYKRSYPARFQLIAAMNPCPCGFLGDTSRMCTCRQHDITRYRSVVSGPLLDRLDLSITLERTEAFQIFGRNENEALEKIRKRVENARKTAHRRYGGFRTNSEMTSSEALKEIMHRPHLTEILECLAVRTGISARAIVSILKVARTIADLSEEGEVKEEHLLEAIQYRTRDTGKESQL